MSDGGPGAARPPAGLLASVFQTYRRGLLRPSAAAAPSDGLPARDFDSLRLLGTLGWIPVAGRLRLRALHRHCARGLSAARQGRLGEARLHYLRAHADLRTLRGGDRAAWLLGAAAYESGLAYLHFRQCREAMARRRLERSMDAALELEGRGLPVMLLHRIQQGHNLVRMGLRRGHREAVIGDAGRLLAYMEGQADGLPYHRCWPATASAAVPRGLLQAMIHQILGETAGVIVTGDDPAPAWHALLAAARPCATPERAVYPQAQHALRAQLALLAHDPGGYLQELQRFFSFGIQRCHLVWYALLVELVAFCAQAGVGDPARVRAAILRDSVRWRSVPPALRQHFDAMAAAPDPPAALPPRRRPDAAA